MCEVWFAASLLETAAEAVSTLLSSDPVTMLLIGMLGGFGLAVLMGSIFQRQRGLPEETEGAPVSGIIDPCA